MKSSKIAKIIAIIGRTSALRASGTASGFGSYQFKEPVAVKELSKKKKLD
jgi:cyclic lactone autoinducer peptide